MEQNYLPLFRKYRPQSFKDVVGQESLVKALSNAIELNRIANAYLFCGPRGTGKTSCARIFAKSLNCESGPTLTPCQKCPSCIDITNASGLDVIEIDAASNRGIQDAKELISQVQYAPINGKYKIFIIDEVHMLSNDAFNALLKTFEEPPKNVIFILATTEPHKVLETIVSRCQRFDLKRITTDDIIKRLREISELENIKITDDALFTIAKNVSGGLRDSLALLDQVSILGVKEEITKSLIEELLGKINFDILLNLLKNINEKNIEKTLLIIDEIYTKGSEPRNLAENFIEFLRNTILILDSKQDENITKLTCLIKEDIQKIRTSNFDKNRIIKILNIFIEYYKEIKISANPYLWMELSAIAAMESDISPIKNTENLINSNISDIKKPVQISTDKTPEVREAKNIIAENKNIQIEQIEPKILKDEPKTEIESENTLQVWINVIANISSLPAKAFFTGVAKLVKVENKKITLGFMHENAIIQAKSDTKYNQLQNAMKAVCPDYEIEFIKIDANTKTIDIKHNTTVQKPQNQPQIHNIENPIKKETEETTEETKEIIKEKKYYSPKVQEMIEQFNGRIIE